MEGTISKLGVIFTQIVENYNEWGMVWENIPLAKEAFAIMKELPDTWEGEFDTPAAKATLLCRMLECVHEPDMARFSLGVREYAATLYTLVSDMSKDDADMCADNEKAIVRMRDYIDDSFPMEEYCKKYNCMLKFDPVERTERWERVIYQVEQECAERMNGEPRGMGYCFGYWCTKRAVLQEYDIDWRDPHMMNPRLIFD